jgi:hypothetical protein
MFAFRWYSASLIGSRRDPRKPAYFATIHTVRSIEGRMKVPARLVMSSTAKIQITVLGMLQWRSSNP